MVEVIVKMDGQEVLNETCEFLVLSLAQKPLDQGNKNFVVDARNGIFGNGNKGLAMSMLDGVKEFACSLSAEDVVNEQK